MTRIDCDLAILGSGFGGTLLALSARKLGYSVALLERGSHPRFAIGESSTPLADFKLAAIAERFGLDWLRPFAKYGTWKARYPNVAAHYCEERERAGRAPTDAAFLLADEEAYRRSAAAACRQAPAVSANDAAEFAAHVRRSLAPYNLSGLGDPRRRNMYPFTGSPLAR